MAKHEIKNFAKHKILTKLFWILQNFTKFKKNMAKHEIKNLSKISWSNENFCSNPTPTQSAVCCTVSSAKTFFMAARQCYFEMMTMMTVAFYSVIYNSVWPIHITHSVHTWALNTDGSYAVIQYNTHDSLHSCRSPGIFCIRVWFFILIDLGSLNSSTKKSI